MNKKLLQFESILKYIIIILIVIGFLISIIYDFSNLDRCKDYWYDTYITNQFIILLLYLPIKLLNTINSKNNISRKILFSLVYIGLFILLNHINWFLGAFLSTLIKIVYFSIIG